MHGQEINEMCPICLRAMQPDEPTDRCSDCLTNFHRSCLTRRLSSTSHNSGVNCSCCGVNMNHFRRQLRIIPHNQPIQPAVLNNAINHYDLGDDDDDDTALGIEYGSTCPCS